METKKTVLGGELVAAAMDQQALADESTQYTEYLDGLNARFVLATDQEKALFTTDVTGLYDLFLSGLPEPRRQCFNCRSCRDFVERFGGLVTISADGVTDPVMWDAPRMPPMFQRSVELMRRAVRKAKVTGVFVTSQQVLGQQSTFVKKPKPGSPISWFHMSARVFPHLQYRPTVLKNEDQRAAELKEDHGILGRAVGEFSIDVVRQAVQLLQAEALYRNEKVIGPARWLLELHEALEGTNIRVEGAPKDSRARDNVLWRAVATAPVGYTHPRSTMIGTLLEDLQAGLPFEDVKRKFAAKMDPTLYQRPQAAPTAGNIAEAERIVAALGLERSLPRRFARLADLKKLWEPKGFVVKGNVDVPGVFGHLKPKGAAPARPVLNVPLQVMTWVKFEQMVLPTAEAMEVEVPLVGNFVAFVTAVNADAPPILQWDDPEARNPVSQYVYKGGSDAKDWGLIAGSRAKVTALVRGPSEWAENGKHAHQGNTVTFVLEGAKDQRHKKGGGFFPETLRSELHKVRATLEAHASQDPIAGLEESTGNGLSMMKGGASGVTVYVTSKLGTMGYRLDRWD